MATALQCPACGYKHRLDALGDAPVFPCANCARQLKLPAQYRDGAARPGSAASPAGSPAGGAGPSGAGRAAPPRSVVPRRGPARATGNDIRLPVRILAWVIAFVAGAFIVRLLAKWTGFVDSNTFVDLMLDHTFATYWRLVVLIPVWAFSATVLATVFIEAPGWWARRNFGTARARPPATNRPATGVPATQVPVSTSPVTPSPTPRAAVATAAAVTGTAATAARATRPSAETPPTSDQRPRRIPRRETGS